MRRAAQWLIAVGLISRLAPLLDQGGRLMRQFPTEDGFLMMTVARNLALGHGLSTSAGLIPTNGVQPLFTFIEALVFAAVGGDRRGGVILILLIGAILACVSGVLLRRLLAGLLADVPRGDEIAALAAALWFAAPLSVLHTMNGLETGLYVGCILAVLLAWVRGRSGTGDLSRRGAAGVGALLGFAFWARNDAIFLMAAVGLAHVLVPVSPAAGLARRLRRVLLMALVALAVSAPWPLYNLLVHGHPMPMSASSQMLEAARGGGLAGAATALFEYLFVIVPIPSAHESRALVVAAAVAACLVYLVVAMRGCARLAPRARSVAAAALMFLGGLVLWYGVIHGAPWFIGRYLFPISPLATAAASAVCATTVFRLSGAARRRAAGRVLVGLVLALVLVANARTYLNGPENRYMPIVDWVERHATPEDWVGSLQSGTLGFFHDRTVNLDGKVNPHALAARREGRAASYAADARLGDPPAPITYIVDWTYIARWLEEPPVAEHYELLLLDRDADLAVLRRRGP